MKRGKKEEGRRKQRRKQEAEKEGGRKSRSTGRQEALKCSRELTWVLDIKISRQHNLENRRFCPQNH